MNDDLYTAPTNSVPTQSSNLGQAISGTSVASPFDLFGIDLGPILHSINMFVLAWTIFYSILFVADFFFYRVKYVEQDVGREVKGVKSIMHAVGMWWSYLFCLFWFGLFTGVGVYWAPLVGYIAILSYFCKIFLADIPVIPVIGKVLGGPGSKVSGLVDSTVTQAGQLGLELISHVAQLFGGGSSGGGGGYTGGSKPSGK